MPLLSPNQQSQSIEGIEVNNLHQLIYIQVTWADMSAFQRRKNYLRNRTAPTTMLSHILTMRAVSCGF